MSRMLNVYVILIFLFSILNSEHGVFLQPVKEVTSCSTHSSEAIKHFISAQSQVRPNTSNVKSYRIRLKALEDNSVGGMCNVDILHFFAAKYLTTKEKSYHYSTLFFSHRCSAHSLRGPPNRA